MPEPTETFTVEQSQPLLRLDTFLRAKFPTISRETFKRLVAEGQVRVNGRG